VRVLHFGFFLEKGRLGAAFQASVLHRPGGFSVCSRFAMSRGCGLACADRLQIVVATDRNWHLLRQRWVCTMWGEYAPAVPGLACELSWLMCTWVAEIGDVTSLREGGRLTPKVLGVFFIKLPQNSPYSKQDRLCKI
jgi:hypothetical protein